MVFGSVSDFHKIFVPRTPNVWKLDMKIDEDKIQL